MVVSGVGCLGAQHFAVKEPSALHRHPREAVNEEESRNRDRMGATPGCLEPAKGRSAGFHNGRTGTGNVYAGRTPLFDRIHPLPPTPTTRRKMRKSQLVAALPLFASLASAQLVYPNCSTGLDWSYNSLNQNPCNVAAYLEATCSGGLYSIAALPQGSLYRGPNAGHDNLCVCNTVVYSLLSACGACQGATSWIQYSQWHLNCSTSSSPGTYPNSIPAGTRVPHWAYLDVSVADTFNATAAQSAGDTPEGTPSTGSSTSTSSTAAPSSSTSSSSNKSSSNSGAIAGGVVGAILGLALLVGLAFWYTRRRQWRSVARPSPFMTDGPHVAEAFGLPDTETSTPMPKFYDPSDPSTFPTTSLVSPSATVIQTTPGSEIAHSSPSPPLSVSDRNRYTGLPIL
ncbi:hypothetical protein V8E53_007984 [Lactarius tabidus]